MSGNSFGFSLWCDFIEREFLEEGFQNLIAEKKINGATSNPAIFQKAITTSSAYKTQVDSLQDASPKERYEAAAITDIKRAAELLAPLYEKSDDGFISIEVDPFLSSDFEGTLSEALRLHESIGHDNVMIKIPATDAGYPVMEALIARDINVNATLIFSPHQAQMCLDAMQKGYAKATKNPKAVLSIFVSRFDRKCDGAFKENGLAVGKLGILNAQKIYKMIEASGQKNIRTLFASTGVKGDEYPKSYYITELLHKNSVNTAPLETIDAYFAQDDRAEKPLPSDAEIESFFETITKSGIDIEKVYQELIDEGLKAFEESFDALLGSLK